MYIHNLFKVFLILCFFLVACSNPASQTVPPGVDPDAGRLPSAEATCFVGAPCSSRMPPCRSKTQEWLTCSNKTGTLVSQPDVSPADAGAVIPPDAKADVVVFDAVAPEPATDAGSDASPQNDANADVASTSTTPTTVDLHGAGWVDPSDVASLSASTSSLGTYLILTRAHFVNEQFMKFVDWRRQSGFDVRFALAEEIVAAASSTNNVDEKVVDFLKALKAVRPDTQYLLIVGAHNADTSSPPLAEAWEFPMHLYPYMGFALEDKPIPSDQFYANMSDAPDFDAKLYVGRVPAKTTQEFADWSEKTMSWKLPVSPIHQEFVSGYCDGQKHDPSDLHALMAQQTHRMQFMYCNGDDGGDIVDFANAAGATYVSTISHAAYYGVVKWPMDKGYELLTQDKPAFTFPPVMFIHGCETAGVDYPEVSLGVKQILARNGAVAYIGSTHVYWNTLFEFWPSVFFKSRLEVGRALYEKKRDNDNGEVLWNELIDNYRMLVLYGDPALRIAEPTVVLEAEKSSIFYTGTATDRTASVSIINSSTQPVSGELRSELRGELPVQVGSKTSLQTDFQFSNWIARERLPLSLNYSGCVPSASTYCTGILLSQDPEASIATNLPTRNADGTYSITILLRRDAPRPFVLRLSITMPQYLTPQQKAIQTTFLTLPLPALSSGRFVQQFVPENPIPPGEPNDGRPTSPNTVEYWSIPGMFIETFTADMTTQLQSELVFSPDIKVN